jgi:peptidyl-tRNA hydrolase
MAKYTIEFVKDKDTKNTSRYSEVEVKGQPTVIGVLYVQKWAANGSDKLVVTVETKES